MNDSAKRKGKYLYQVNRAAHVTILWAATQELTSEETLRLQRMEDSLRSHPAFGNLTFAPKDGYCGVVEEFDVHMYKGKEIFYPCGAHILPLPHYMQVVGKGYYQYEQ